MPAALLNSVICGNIRGLYTRVNKTKPLYLQSLANQLNAFIVYLTEIHLSNEVFDANIHINGFTPFRCDRSNRKCGGVMIYVKDILTDVVEIF